MIGVHNSPWISLCNPSFRTESQVKSPKIIYDHRRWLEAVPELKFKRILGHEYAR